MENTDPDKEKDMRPAAVLEKTSVRRNWLLGIALTAVVGVCALMSISGGERVHKSSRKEKKERTKPVGALKDTINGHEWVDLGLPSGVKWATYNVGAASPTESGDYYAWGETETKDEYIDINSLTHRKDFKWLKGKDIIGEGGELTRKHDVATQIWGEPWRMPTDEEFEELIENCTWDFTDYNGTHGYVVTGPNHETIFLVAAGFKQESGAEYLGEYGDYWSASVVPELIGASCSLGYGPTSYGRRRYARFVGRTIRPVTD